MIRAARALLLALAAAAIALPVKAQNPATAPAAGEVTERFSKTAH